jgi:hypothetical protein
MRPPFANSRFRGIRSDILNALPLGCRETEEDFARKHQAYDLSHTGSKSESRQLIGDASRLRPARAIFSICCGRFATADLPSHAFRPCCRAMTTVDIHDRRPPLRRCDHDAAMRRTPWRRGKDSNPLPFARTPAFLRLLHPRSQPICTPIMLQFAPLWQRFSFSSNRSLSSLHSSWRVVSMKRRALILHA